MGIEIVDFDVRHGLIAGVLVITPKRVTDDRGTIRELFRRTAFEQAGVDLSPFQQINVTGSSLGVVRGMHAENMTKLVTIATGAAHGAYVDLRPDSLSYGRVDTIELHPGVQVLVPAGVANGFQALTDDCQYVYCFDAEWAPAMSGLSCTPLDPELEIAWPLPIDPDDPTQISVKDRDAPTLHEVMKVRKT